MGTNWQARRYVLLDKKTKEPQAVCMGVSALAKSIGVGYTAARLNKYDKEKAPFVVQTAEEWEEANGEYLPGKRIELT